MNTMTEAPRGEEPTTLGHILVALDASPYSQAALMAAAELAANLHLELRGLFVEDINLLHLCGLPFGLEIGSFTATPRRLEQTYLEREFRVQATTLRKAMAEAAGRRRVAWSFQVVRGAVTDQLLAAAVSARMVTLGRVGHSPGKRLGSTARSVARNTQRPVLIQSTRRRLSGPYVVFHTPTAAGANSLALAAQLAVQEQSALTVLLVGGEQEGVKLQAELAEMPISVTIKSLADENVLLGTLTEMVEGTVILPVESADMLEHVSATAIIVP